MTGGHAVRPPTGAQNHDDVSTNLAPARLASDFSRRVSDRYERVKIPTHPDMSLDPDRQTSKEGVVGVCPRTTTRPASLENDARAAEICGLVRYGVTTSASERTSTSGWSARMRASACAW